MAVMISSTLGYCARGVCALTLSALACGNTANPPQDLEAGPSQGPCPSVERVGFLELRLADGFSAFSGQVESATDPFNNLSVERQEGNCQLVSPPTLFCDPPCAGSEVCAGDNQCRVRAVGVSLGQLRLQGLAEELVIPAPSAPVFRYDFLGDLPHPATQAGQDLSLQVEGNDEVPAFALRATGIDALRTTASSLPLRSGETLVIEWVAGLDTSHVELDLNIAQHGGIAGAVHCQVEDTGSFAMPQVLTDALLSRGASGFPSIGLTRKSADHHDTTYGCVEFRSISEATVEIEIDGLTSCSGPMDCPDGQVCRPDLTCG